MINPIVYRLHAFVFTGGMNYLKHTLKNITTLRRQLHTTRVKYTTNITEHKEFFTKATESKIDPKRLPVKTTIDAKTIALLERLSLVDCANKQSIQVLEDAIEFADQILQIDTTGVEPLVTVLEDKALETRNDQVVKTNRKDILLNASVTEEEYFVAPPGNIPLEPRDNLLHEDIKTIA